MWETTNLPENQKPPAAFAGGGLDAFPLNPFRQAPISARMLWPLIRMAGMEIAPEKPVVTIAMALKLRMTLIRVDQRRGARVKKMQSAKTQK
jgi:hypothetical protein